MEQLTIMEYLLQQTKQPLKIDKPIRLIELFAGIGSQAKALSRLGANFEHYRVCEFDKYAIKSYNAIHGTNFAASDITKITADDLGIVDTDKYCYIMTYSFPCQDLSLAGKQKGMAKGNNTRSGLLWEVERLLNECNELPQILLMENVTQVHGSKNKEHFNEWIRFLESKGYSNYWKDLNSKNFGIPQNRNRTFMVSVLGNYRYEFPKAFPLEIRLKDVLEDSVDEKHYLSSKTCEKLVRHKNKIIENDTPDISGCIHAGYYKMGGRDQQYVKRIFVDNDIKPCVRINFEREKEQIAMSNKDIYQCTCDGGWQDNKVGIGLSPTIRAGNKDTFVLKKTLISRLTPKECFRLMGFKDEDFEKAEKVNSNTQLYKQAGNSIVVDVLVYIFKQML